jgi:SAM-dependent methyltransferase
VSRIPEGVSLESWPCPMKCGAGDFTVLTGRDRLHGIPGDFTVVKCRGCGLMRTDPRPTADSIGAYYPDNYAPYSEMSAELKALSNWKGWLYRLMKLETRRTPPMPVGMLLELGCASGGYLEKLQQAGWQVEGIEFSVSAAQRAREKGLKVQTGAAETAVVADASIDLVAAWMVVEHLHDPLRTLEKIRGWIRGDGYLAISIPLHRASSIRVFGNASYDLHLPNHLFHFNRRSIEAMLDRAGWQVEDCFWQRNPNTLLNTLENSVGDRGWRRTTKIVHWLRTSRSMGKPRLLLGWLLGVTHTSGRVEIWARPKGNPSEKS